MMSAEQTSGCMMPGNSMRVSKSAPCSPIKPIANWPVAGRVDPFHVVHKVPVGDSPYVKAKHVQVQSKSSISCIDLHSKVHFYVAFSFNVNEVSLNLEDLRRNG